MGLASSNATSDANASIYDQKNAALNAAFESFEKAHGDDNPTPGGGVTYNPGAGFESYGTSGSVPIGLSSGGSTVEVDPSLFQNASNAATQTGQQDFQRGQAAANQQAAQINNPYAAQSVAALNATRGQYGQLDQGLAATANGGGINAGQAQYMQAQNQGIAAQMAAAHAGHGSYSGGAAYGAMGGGASANMAAAQQGAAVRAQQIAAAQQGLGSSLAAQGNMNLNEYGTQQGAAQAQATIQEQQNQMNNAQYDAWNNSALAQQGAQLNDINEAGNAQAAAKGLSISQQQLNNQQLGTVVGSTLKAVGPVLGLAAAAL